MHHLTQPVFAVVMLTLIALLQMGGAEDDEDAPRQ